MGGTVTDYTRSASREVEYRSMSREQVFKAREIHDSLNPFKLKVREARDSDVHPNTVPVIVAFDVTGSMGNIPYKLAQEHFTKLMIALIENGVPDVTICFCAVGDHYYDSAPLQVGQFESGDIELTNDLTNIWLEGGGGGQRMESYMLPWLFAARHTVTDAFEKRGKKGFLFTIGDEWNHPRVESAKLKKILGYPEAEDEASVQLLKEAQQKWNVYHIHCSDGTYGEDISDKWKDLLGENLFILDSSKIVDLIATTVAVSQGASEVQVKETLKNNSYVKEDITKVEDYHTVSFIK